MQDNGRGAPRRAANRRRALQPRQRVPEMGHRSPASLGGSPVLLHLQVDDVDAFFARAPDPRAGARRTERSIPWRPGLPPVDASGHVWLIATRKEDVSPQEMQRRMDSTST